MAHACELGLRFAIITAVFGGYMWNQVNDERDAVEMLDDGDFEEVFLDDRDEEDWDEMLREFLVVSAKPH